ncbi:nucleotidyltransferase family protein [Spirillospora sp. CA-142024]|uniref:nucleotidyltransferase family protein n=1 Tax=Spirillospora sp. CA-142024 TaxID=3240036 RepID=UPI003D8F701C
MLDQNRLLCRLLDDLLETGLERPSPPAEIHSLLALPDLADAERAKLSYLALHFAERWDVTLTAEQSAELSRLRRRTAILERELATVGATLNRGGADYVLLRAVGLSRFYPDGWVRQYNDVDILLRDDRSLPAALDRLRGLGYYLARPIASRRSGTGLWLGLALNRQVSDLGHPMYLDLTTLGPALSRARSLTLPEDAWRRREQVTVAGTPIPVLDPTWQAVVFAGEMVERDGAYQPRDALDLVMLHRGGARWPEVAARLRSAPDAAEALGRVAELARSSLPAAGLGTDPPVSRPAGRWPLPGAPSRLPYWRDAVVEASDALVRAVRRVSPRAARHLVERAPARAWFAAGLPVYLLPVPPPQVHPGVFRGGTGRQTAGLSGLRGRVYPLVPRGYSKAVFTPPLTEVGQER